MESLDGPSMPGELTAEARELAALRAGDEATFLMLVKRHHGAMLRLAACYVGSRASAEEVAQEAWVGVLKGLGQFEGRCSLKSWIFRIVVNVARKRGARDGRSVPLSSLATEDPDDGPVVAAERFQDDGGRWAGNWAQPPSPWPDARVESGELVALVGEAMEALPAAQRTVMTLRDIDGLEAAEVCELLGLSETNQRVLLHRARSRVRALVEARMAQEVPG